MAPTAPSPITWTLRFKYGKSTTLLHVDPLQTLGSIKTELLRALHATHPDGLLAGLQIPQSPEDIVLGTPVDPNKLSETEWTRLDTATDVRDEAENGVNGKEAAGKKKRTKTAAMASAALDSPQGQGLKDGAVLAFRVKSDGDEAIDLDDEQFKVQLPKFDDPFDEEKESATETARA